MTATIVTPSARVAARRWLFWIVAAVFVILVAIASLLITGAGRAAGTPFSATDAGPSGSKAVAEVLRQQGVRVTATDGFADTRSALGRAGDDTLLIVDPNGYLDEARLRELGAAARHVVLLDPGAAQLEALAPGVTQGRAVTRAALRADCDLPPVRNAGTVTGQGRGYRVDGSGGFIRCLGSGDGVFSLVALERSGRTVTVLGTDAALSNEHVAERGNAALALTLLGDNDHLVWYLPAIDDAALGRPATIAELTPPWVPTVMVLLVITAIAAALWRGRRFGPLVVENLPVVVRSSETMEGRARLYQRGSARLRALDALRVGTVSRLAATCGLSRTATVDEVVAAVAGATRRDPGSLRSLLLDAVPATDRELVRLSDALLEIERATAGAVRPTEPRASDRGE